MLKDFQFTAQARLGRIHDNMRRKCIDLQNKFIALPVECLRIKAIKSRENDTIIHNVKKAEICHVVFPVMQNLPLRTIEKNGNMQYHLSSLVNAFADEDQKQFYTIKSSERLTVDDLIIRVLFPEEKNNPLNVLILKVLEPLGTLGMTSIIELSYNCALNTEELPAELSQMIIDWAVRRSKIDF